MRGRSRCVMRIHNGIKKASGEVSAPINVVRPSLNAARPSSPVCGILDVLAPCCGIRVVSELP